MDKDDIIKELERRIETLERLIKAEKEELLFENIGIGCVFLDDEGELLIKMDEMIAVSATTGRIYQEEALTPIKTVLLGYSEDCGKTWTEV